MIEKFGGKKPRREESIKGPDRPKIPSFENTDRQKLKLGERTTRILTRTLRNWFVACQLAEIQALHMRNYVMDAPGYDPAVLLTKERGFAYQTLYDELVQGQVSHYDELLPYVDRAIRETLTEDDIKKLYVLLEQSYLPWQQKEKSEKLESAMIAAISKSHGAGRQEAVRGPLTYIDDSYLIQLFDFLFSNRRIHALPKKLTDSFGTIEKIDQVPWKDIPFPEDRGIAIEFEEPIPYPPRYVEGCLVSFLKGPVDETTGKPKVQIAIRLLETQGEHTCMMFNLLGDRQRKDTSQTINEIHAAQQARKKSTIDIAAKRFETNLRKTLNTWAHDHGQATAALYSHIDLRPRIIYTTTDDCIVDKKGEEDPFRAAICKIVAGTCIHLDSYSRMYGEDATKDPTLRKSRTNQSQKSTSSASQLPEINLETDINIFPLQGTYRYLQKRNLRRKKVSEPQDNLTQESQESDAPTRLVYVQRYTRRPKGKGDDPDAEASVDVRGYLVAKPISTHALAVISVQPPHDTNPASEEQ